MAGLLAERLGRDVQDLRARWLRSGPVPHLVVDDLLPADLAREIVESLPDPSGFLQRSSLRERKRVGIALEDYAPVVRDALLAFQEPQVVRAVGRIIESEQVVPDPTFYASGLSVMGPGDFVHPHVDNSHDGDQRLYRVLNLLYYVNPDWSPECGGNLELWDDRRRDPHTVVSGFNRLVVMATQRRSWHSVDPVRAPAPRWCLSNYYFAEEPLEGGAYRHVTTFRGRRGEPLRDTWLLLDGLLRNAVGRAFPSLVRHTRHRRSA